MKKKKYEMLSGFVLIRILSHSKEGTVISIVRAEQKPEIYQLALMLP